VRTHVARLIAERPKWTSLEREIALDLLDDADPFVRRAAADAIGCHGQLSAVDSPLGHPESTPKSDDHLIHTIRVAVRNILAASNETAELAIGNRSPSELRPIASIAPAVKTKAGAHLLAAILERDAVTIGDLVPDAAWP